MKIKESLLLMLNVSAKLSENAPAVCWLEPDRADISESSQVYKWPRVPLTVTELMARGR